jgi:cytidine deaminase
MRNEMDLVAIARSVAKNAYAPYSHFCVGAALEASDGSVYTGCNVENASYGLTICAERAAICNAIQAGRQTFRAIAIVAQHPVTPCGACRQVLAEFAQDGFKVMIASLDGAGDIKVYSMVDLLPHQFVLTESTQKETYDEKTQNKGS